MTVCYCLCPVVTVVHLRVCILWTAGLADGSFSVFIQSVFGYLGLLSDCCWIRLLIVGDAYSVPVFNQIIINAKQLQYPSPLLLLCASLLAPPSFSWRCILVWTNVTAHLLIFQTDTTHHSCTNYNTKTDHNPLTLSFHNHCFFGQENPQIDRVRCVTILTRPCFSQCWRPTLSLFCLFTLWLSLAAVFHRLESLTKPL